MLANARWAMLLYMQYLGRKDSREIPEQRSSDRCPLRLLFSSLSLSIPCPCAMFQHLTPVLGNSKLPHFPFAHQYQRLLLSRGHNPTNEMEDLVFSGRTSRQQNLILWLCLHTLPENAK
jgi:hypothetical protein